jgi:hypothetical protein
MLQGVINQRKKKSGSGNSNKDSVISGSGPDYHIFIPLDWASWLA